MGLVAGALTVATALFAFVNGCGDADAPGTGGSEGNSATSVALPQVPPIDRAAPTDFQTASFALG